MECLDITMQNIKGRLLYADMSQYRNPAGTM